MYARRAPTSSFRKVLDVRLWSAAFRSAVARKYVVSIAHRTNGDGWNYRTRCRTCVEQGATRKPFVPYPDPVFIIFPSSISPCSKHDVTPRFLFNDGPGNQVSGAAIARLSLFAEEVSCQASAESGMLRMTTMPQCSSATANRSIHVLIESPSLSNTF